MFVLKKLIFFSLILLVSSCTLNNIRQIQDLKNYSIKVETPNDRFNLYLKENLKHFFYISNSKRKYILKTNITFESTKTLSVSGQSVLKSTKARIDYLLSNKDKNVVIKSGSIYTFPVLSSSSNSLYTQEKSIDHIKERLVKSSAKSLYTRIKIIIRRSS